MEKHFDPIIHSKLQSFAQRGGWQEMQNYLESLSHSAFRTASYVLSERVLVQLENESFWQCFEVVALSNTKAYLMTFLKAASNNYQDNRLSFSSTEFVSFGQRAQTAKNSIDRQKALHTVLPLLRSVKEAQQVLDAFCGEDWELKIGYLVAVQESKPLYYILFQLFRNQDFTAQKLAKHLRQVLHRSTSMAFNFASIAQTYFGLEGLSTQFSLQIEPYKLSRIEKDYEAFCLVLTTMN